MQSLLVNNPKARVACEVLCIYMLLESAAVAHNADLNEYKKKISAKLSSLLPTTSKPIRQMAELLKQGSSIFAELQQRKVIIDRVFIDQFRETMQAHRDIHLDPGSLSAAKDAAKGTGTGTAGNDKATPSKRGIWNMWRSSNNSSNNSNISNANSKRNINNNSVSSPWTGEGPAVEDINEFISALLDIPFSASSVGTQQHILRAWEHWWSATLRDTAGADADASQLYPPNVPDGNPAYFAVSGTSTHVHVSMCVCICMCMCMFMFMFMFVRAGDTSLLQN